MQQIINNRHLLDDALPGAHGWRNLAHALDRLKHADALELHIACNRILLDTELPSAALWQRIAQEMTTANHPDLLKDYISAHRDELDAESPSPALWERIASSTQGRETPGTVPLPAPLKVSWMRRLSRVAAAVVFLVSGVGLGIWYSNHAQSTGMSLSEVSPEYAELEQHYEREIANKRAQLVQLTQKSPSSEELFVDIDLMDKAMQELRVELANLPASNREQVIRAMIENYTTKAKILERVLNTVELEQNLKHNGTKGQAPDGRNEKNEHETESI
jgi:hypothetical protein